MGLGYCIKCKQKTEVKDGTIAYYHNGTPIEKGICSGCGSKMTRILTREERQALKNEQKTETEPKPTD